MSTIELIVLLLLCIVPTYPVSGFYFRGVRLMHRKTSIRSSFGTNYLERMVRMKQVEVEHLLKRHTNDSVFMRMNFLSMDPHHNVSVSLRKDGFGKENLHKMSIMVDMKRTSPTTPSKRDIIDYPDAADFAKLLCRLGFDALMVNADETYYGGNLEEFERCSKAIRQTFPDNPPACIYKDIIIHPIQVARALENGASGVILNTIVLGDELENMLNACTLMGADAIVEVHTPAELDVALEAGATIIMVNMWNRISGELFPNQAKRMACQLPVHTIAIAAGNIQSLDQVSELGYAGYDCIVLGRNLPNIPDIKMFVDGVHNFVGKPRNMNLGNKATVWELI